MKRALLTSTIFCVALGIPLAAAQAQDITVSQSVTVSTGYVFEKQAVVVSDNPAVSSSATLNVGDFHPYGWVQVGDEAAQELDAGVRYGHQFASGVSVRAEVSGYFYPTTGYDAIYTAAIGVTVPVGHGFSLSGDAQRYEGGLQTTNLSLGITHNVGPAAVTLGHSWNYPENTEPTWAQVSFPLGDRFGGATFTIHGFVGAGSGVAAEVSVSF